MKRKAWFIGVIAGSIGIAFLSLTSQPAQVSAGGWPCFTCHGGFDVPGTDLAPPLAGSKLTDEQIIAQVRHPRGMMPAFSREEISDEALKDGFIQPFIRGLPAGQPTATLSPQNRSVALAWIAGVAAVRATEYAQQANASSSVAAVTATPSATVSTNSEDAKPSSTSEAASPLFTSVFAVIGIMLAVSGAGVWLWRH